LSTKTLTRGGLLLALAVILPQVLHLTGGPQLGSIVLPMHFPVYIAGFLLGPALGGIIGFLAPLISHMITGMPPVSPPVLFLMLVELPLFGLLAGYLYRQRGWKIIPALLLAMVGGRVGMALISPLIFYVQDFPVAPLVYVQGALITGLPGIFLQILIIPILFKTRFMEVVAHESPAK